MKISIFGLGYVGVVSAACLADHGHRIIGVDINATKGKMLNEGLSPIIEPKVPELLTKACEQRVISATTNAKEAIQGTEMSIICVGTPSRSNGSLDITHLKHVTEQIGQCLKGIDREHILVYRSTMLPGTLKELIIPVLEAESGKQEGVDFYVMFNPEFLRESTAVDDFNNPPKTVIGASSNEVAEKVMDSLYKSLPGPKFITDIETAEMVKYVDNNFHALKVTFANEVGHICKKLGLDGHKVMDIFVQDKKLNLSPYYLKPGFAFGGSCLPKDLRAMNYLSKMNDLDTPLLESIMNSNNAQVLHTIKRIISFEKKKLGVAGFSFKAGTDDLRESPLVEVIETLLGKGFDLKIYDKNVSLAKLVGANKEYIEKHLPHISSLMVDSLDELLKDRELIIIGNKDEEFKRLLTETSDDQMVFDLVRISDDTKRKNYEGICW